MIGMNIIRLRKKEDSKCSLLHVEQHVKEKLKEVASSTRFDIWNDGEKVTVMLRRPISLQTVNQMLHFLQTKRIRINEFSWKENDKGPVRRGELDIIIS